jgi:hypothetical protein
MYRANPLNDPCHFFDSNVTASTLRTHQSPIVMLIIIIFFIMSSSRPLSIHAIHTHIDTHPNILSLLISLESSSILVETDRHIDRGVFASLSQSPVNDDEE